MNFTGKIAILENDYLKEFNDCKSKIDAETSPCKQLDILKECSIKLDQMKNTYWRRPCWRDWPCLFTQHHSKIDKMKETLSPLERKLTRECQKQSRVDFYKEVLEQGANTANSSMNINKKGDRHNSVQANILMLF